MFDVIYYFVDLFLGLFALVYYIAILNMNELQENLRSPSTPVDLVLFLG